MERKGSGNNLENWEEERKYGEVYMERKSMVIIWEVGLGSTRNAKSKPFNSY